MGIFRTAAIIFAFLFVPYLLFVLPKRVRNHKSARMRYYIFFFVVVLFVLIVIKRIK